MVDGSDAVIDDTGDSNQEAIGALPPIERSTTLTRRAIELIRRAIVDGTLPPGGQITLREMARRLGVSQTPIREALTHLEAIGFIEVEPGRIQIAAPTPSALRNAFELREALEGMVGRLAAQRRTEDEVRQIEAFAAHSLAAVERHDVVEFRRYDSLFHRSIGKAAHSEQVERYHANALDLAVTLRNLRTAGANFNASAAPMHVEIAQAIAKRDADAAERVSRAHVRAVCSNITPGSQAPTGRREEGLAG